MASSPHHSIKQTLFKKEYALLFVIALLLRAGTLFFFTQHHERYKQPDSQDYHNASLCMGLGYGMTYPNGPVPIFWRTPGYPAYLGTFYKWFGLTSADFSSNGPAQRASLWVQVIVASCIPIILFLLALQLTQIPQIAWATAWIAVFHVGLILNSTYLLTEGISMLFFYLFLLFLFRTFIGTPPCSWIKSLSTAAIMLGIYTWMRPMGELVGLFAGLLLLIFAHDVWQDRLKKALFFLSLFLFY